MEILRTCIACRQKFPQNELIRFGLRKEGGVRVSKGSGRGVYLCRKAACLGQLTKNPKKMKHFLGVTELPKNLLN